MLSASQFKLHRYLPFCTGCLSLLLSLVASPAIALELRIALLQGQGDVVIGSSTSANIVNGQGTTVGALPPLEGFFAKSTPGAVTFLAKRDGNFPLSLLKVVLFTSKIDGIEVRSD